MRRLALVSATIVGAAILSAAPMSINRSGERNLSVSLDKAYAVVGRPLTPGSVAGVNRRHSRRAVRRCAAGVTCPNY
jgi:hypothetical protein